MTPEERCVDKIVYTKDQPDGISIPRLYNSKWLLRKLEGDTPDEEIVTVVVRGGKIQPTVKLERRVARLDRERQVTKRRIRGGLKAAIKDHGGAITLSLVESATKRVFGALLRGGPHDTQITSNDGGYPLVRGTHLRVSQVLAELSEGRTITELAETYDVDAAVLVEVLQEVASCYATPVVPEAQNNQEENQHVERSESGIASASAGLAG